MQTRNPLGTQRHPQVETLHVARKHQARVLLLVQRAGQVGRLQHLVLQVQTFVALRLLAVVPKQIRAVLFWQVQNSTRTQVTRHM